MDCNKKDDRDLIDEAGKMIGLDLKNPIDCSQMSVYNISSEAAQERDRYGPDFGSMYMLRKAMLFAYVYNEYGDQEELTIEFTLKSSRRPKL